MQRNTILRAYKHYGLTDIQLLREQKGYRNTSYSAQLADGKRLNLIVYKQEEGMKSRIERIHIVSNALSLHGLPTRQAYNNNILVMRANNSSRYAALYNYLPGRTIPWEAYTKHHIKLVGMTMGYIHTALKDTSLNNPKVTDEYITICDHMEAYFSTPGVIRALQQKLNLKIPSSTLSLYKTALKHSKQLPDQQMLHMDLVRGNILFENNDDINATLRVNEYVVSGILDLEKTAYGHPIFDIARTLAFLLIDSKYKSPDKVQKYFLESGYKKRGQGKIPHITFKINGDTYSALDLFTNLFLFYDLYKFLRHNPYEALEQNEHFERTRTTLIEQKVIQSV